MSAHDRIAARLEAWTGITRSSDAAPSALGRFVDARVRELRLASADDYLALLSARDAPEASRMIDAVTVPHTWFFRDPGQLDAAPELFRRVPAQRPVRVWVPGCATGEDAYTIALLAMRAGRDVEVLGTDVSGRAIERAQRGVYDAWSVRDVPSDLRSELSAHGDGSFSVGASVRKRVSFAHHNVLDQPVRPSTSGGWDLVVFRNVLIYFARTNVEAAVARIAAAIAPGGWLMLGASDIFFRLPPCLRPCPPWRALERIEDAPPVAPPPVAPPPIPPHREAPPASAIEIVSKGNACLDCGDLGGALTMYAEASLLDPTCAEAHLFAGIAHHTAGDPEAANASLRACLLLGPSLWPAAFYLGLAYERLGRRDDAQRAFRSVVRASAAPFEVESRSALAEDFRRWSGDILAAARRKIEHPDGER